MSELSDRLYIKLDERLDAANAEIAALKGKVKKAETKSFLQKLVPYTAIGAFLISLTTALFTYYDRFVTGPAEDARATMDKMSEIALTLNRATLEGPKELQAVMAAMAPQRTGLLERAIGYFETQPDLLTYADYLLLGNELINFGNTGLAAEVADAAMERTADPLAQANAKLLKASALTMLSSIRDLPKARALLDSAIAEVKNTNAPSVYGVMMDIHAGRIFLELMAGQCELAQSRVAEFARALDQRQIPEMFRDNARQSLSSAQETVPGDCRLDLSAL
ncbi:MAG: hypothetical protein AB8B85_05775 [Paracoccaceae bacterium]